MKKYSEKLLSPNWQKKRLEIFNRDGFTCQNCGNKEQTLHVHHKTYEYGKDPWDYLNDNFVTLCSDCHEYEEFCKIDANGLVHDLLLMGYSNEVIKMALFDGIKNYSPKFPPFFKING